jgi:hypothetical protein
MFNTAAGEGEGGVHRASALCITAAEQQQQQQGWWGWLQQQVSFDMITYCASLPN